MPQSILDSFLSGVSRAIKPDTAAGETRLGGVGDALKSAVVGALQVTPEGRAIRQQGVHDETVQNMRNQQLRITLAAKDPSLLLLPEMARAFDSALGKGAADMALVKYAQEQHQNEIFDAMLGGGIAGPGGGAVGGGGGVAGRPAPQFGDAERMDASGALPAPPTAPAPAPTVPGSTIPAGTTLTKRLSGGRSVSVAGPSRSEARDQAFFQAFNAAINLFRSQGANEADAQEEAIRAAAAITGYVPEGFRETFLGPAKTAQQLGVEAGRQQLRTQFAGPQAEATERGKQEVQLPTGAFVSPDTGKVVSTPTAAQVRRQGLMRVNDQQLATLQGLDNIDAMVDRYKKVAGRLFNTDDQYLAAANAAAYKKDAFTRNPSNPDVVTLRSLNARIKGIGSRMLAAERGVLTDADLNRLTAAFLDDSNFFETKTSAEAKINELLTTIRDLRAISLGKEPPSLVEQTPPEAPAAPTAPTEPEAPKTADDYIKKLRERGIK